MDRVKNQLYHTNPGERGFYIQDILNAAQNIGESSQLPSKTVSSIETDVSVEVIAVFRFIRVCI